VGTLTGVRGRGLLVAAVAALALGVAAPASAGGWLPHPADATWTYQWTDSVFNTTPTNESVTVDKKSAGNSFTLDWDTAKAGTPDGLQSAGSVSFQETNFGIVNTDWTSSPPPASFPILCAAVTQCGNSLAGAYYNLIWGARAPTLFEPLLSGTSWSSSGAAQNDVTSSNDYLGTETITVPAFPQPVVAAKVQSQITQAGALGDPYGSGVRTVWWVYGVGPVKILFQHAGGTGAAVTTVLLQSTNQTPQMPPADSDYFPMQVGLHGTYRWTNKRYFKQKPEVEKFNVDQASNGTAVLKVSSVSGPMKVAGAYQFTTRLDGVTSVASATKAASLVKLPALGPSSAPATKRRHFFTPFDLMTFGFNPVIPAYPVAGDAWSADPKGRDFAVYGVTGSSRVVGIQKVKVPAGTFDALVVSSNLTQPGFKFGSGTRTMWFVAGKGLVKLVFRHRDGSTSTVELLK
jgi:hypothetical protein